jgi:aspartate ammonia-lyase
MRTEHDLLGELDVPAAAYYGIHTARAVANFPISGIAVSQLTELVTALAAVKEAAALANCELGQLDATKAAAIVAAAQEIRAGLLHEQFCLDVMQGGAGTSTNMAANEVIANRALELLGHDRGDYRHLHPLEDVNLGQSTNDVYPTALRIAIHRLVNVLIGEVERLRYSLEERSRAFVLVTKLGRTQLQDALPMTLGQEFQAWASTLKEEEDRLGEVTSLLCEINLGGTAIGTSANTHPDFPARACVHLAEITGQPLVTAVDLVEATSDAGVFVTVSSTVKRTALKISKICNDLRLLASGPMAGFGELNLPAMQSGSSIMPGKVNPVIPEAVNQIAFDVIGADLTITLAANAGQLQLNAFEPVIAAALFRSIRQLAAGCTLLAERCVAGITANAQTMRRHTLSETGLLTALVPRLGYEAVTQISVEATRDHRTIEEILLARGLIDRTELARLVGSTLQATDMER